MATAGDIRDIMELGNGPQPAPKKKRKLNEQPRLTGVSREVQALMGDSVPPIAIVETPRYKSRPSLATKLFKPRHWEERPFQHGARKDGLVLRHWKRSVPGLTGVPSLAKTTTPTDVEMQDKEAVAVGDIRFEEEFPMERWDVKPTMPAYTDEQYNNLLKADDWTREETDYLMELSKDFDLRWVLIADRYNPKDVLAQPSAQIQNGNGISNGLQKSTYPDRSTEALKARYYTIAAKMLEASTPASSMTQSEFLSYERMKNFDAKTETQRKQHAEKLFERSKDEAEEERILLEELYRITKNADDFLEMRRDLYARLEPAPSLRRTDRGEEQSTAMYQTSGGLSMLLQNLVAREKRFKRPPLPNGADAASAGTPTDAQRLEKGRHANQYSRRDTMDTQATDDTPGPQKKASVSQAPVVRTLAPQEEAKYGVTHPAERITSGVQFRHEKINRLTMAKSQVQTSKIQAALTELGIPPRLLMPTERVCREFERLVGEIQLLLDARKVNEKVSTEIKVLEELRQARLGEGTSEVPVEPKSDLEAAEIAEEEKNKAEQERQDEAEVDESRVEEDTTMADVDDDAEDDQRDNQDDEQQDDNQQEDDDDDDDDEGVGPELGDGDGEGETTFALGEGGSDEDEDEDEEDEADDEDQQEQEQNQDQDQDQEQDEDDAEEDEDEDEDTEL